MSRSKTLWERECEQICQDYQDGKMSLAQAMEELCQRGWDEDDAACELAEWAAS